MMKSAGSPLWAAVFTQFGFGDYPKSRLHLDYQATQSVTAICGQNTVVSSPRTCPSEEREKTQKVLQQDQLCKITNDRSEGISEINTY